MLLVKVFFYALFLHVEVLKSNSLTFDILAWFKMKKVVPLQKLGVIMGENWIMSMLLTF